ncbi:hypothetical protein FACS1894211_03790 [Clostridia bacterium]|nr:hypothetical protein FACS1894211_03790 [Clostridia bacterium]
MLSCVIDRFSEDIDVNLAEGTSQNRKKNFKDYVIRTAEELGLRLTNPENIVRWDNYNNYHIDYPTLFPSGSVRQELLVEAVFRISSFPTETMPAASMIYDYLQSNGESELIEKYDLAPFNIPVQSLERTFIDKVYALCDYYVWMRRATAAGLSPSVRIARCKNRIT